MDELRLELENCYGIQKLSTTIDYSNNNVAIIYAPVCAYGRKEGTRPKTFCRMDSVYRKDL